MQSEETIAYSRCHLAPTGSSLAFQLGYLSAAAESGGAAGSVDFKLGDYDHYGDRYWIRHAANAKAMWARARGADTRAIGFSWYESALPLFAKQGSGIQGPADLKGRRIAGIRVKNQAFDYDRMVYLRPFVTGLATAGLTLADVTLVDVEVEREMIHSGAAKQKPFPAQMAELFVAMLNAGEVDAIATSLSVGAIETSGLRKIYDGRTDPDVNARVDLRTLVVSGSVVRERRDVLVRLVAGLLRAGRWAAGNTEKVLPAIASDVGLDEAFLRNRGIDFVRASHIDMTGEMLEIMRKRKQFLLETGLLDRDFALEEWIDPTILRDARELSKGDEAGWALDAAPAGSR